MTFHSLLGATYIAALRNPDTVSCRTLADAWATGAHSPELRALVAGRPELEGPLRAAVAADSCTPVRAAFLVRPDLTADELGAALRTAGAEAVAYAARLSDDPDRLAALAGVGDPAAPEVIWWKSFQLPLPTPIRRSALIATSRRKGYRPATEEEEFALADTDGVGAYLAGLQAPQVLAAIVRRSDLLGADLHPLTVRLAPLAERDLYHTIDLAQSLLDEGRLDRTGRRHLANAETVMRRLNSPACVGKLSYLQRTLGENTQSTLAAIAAARASVDPAELRSMALDGPRSEGHAWAIASNPHADSTTTALVAPYVASVSRLVEVRRAQPAVLTALVACPELDFDGPLGDLPHSALVAAAGNTELVLGPHSPLEVHCLDGLIADGVAEAVRSQDALELIRRQTPVGLALASWLTDMADLQTLELALGLAETFNGTLEDLLYTAESCLAD